MKDLIPDITAAVIEGAADFVHSLDLAWDGIVKPTYPSNHEAGMRVPKGGSSCASCEYLAGDGKECSNEHFQKWNGNNQLPAPADEYCSDWYEENKEINAGGPGSGRHPYGKKEVYHGTFGKLADKIAKNGLQAKSTFKGVKMVWATKDKEEALGYGISKVDQGKLGVSKSGGQVALIVIDPVKANFDQAYKDMNIQYVVSKGAPPESIKRIEIYDRDELYKVLNSYKDIDTLKRSNNLPLPKPVRVIKSESDEDEIYVTMIADDNDIEAATENSLAGDQKGSLWKGMKITGFTAPEEEGLRAMLSRIPPELFTGITEIKSAKELNAKHGKYIPEEKIMLFNPSNFSLRQRFGKGDGWIYHAEMTVIHEVGHAIYESFDETQKASWMALGGWCIGWAEGQSLPYHESRPGWPKDVSQWTHRAGIRIPRHYSERNPNECFADCFAFYILGKRHQVETSMGNFIEALIKERVKKYPSVLIESPTKPYGTK